MNYYKRHIGDYVRRTAHLTFVEDAAYNRLLDVYYTREAPISADISQACRLVRASSKAEREAVESVLKEFFTLEADGWHNKRCDEELAADQAFIAKQRANGLASAAKRASNAGSTTVQPPLDSGTNQTPNQIQPPTSHLPLPNQSKSELRSPDTTRGSRIPEDFALTDERRNVAIAEGLDPTRTLASFRDFWISKPGAAGRKVDWDATWRNWCRNDKSPRKQTTGGGNGLPVFNAG